MSGYIFYVSYKLKKAASVPEFLQASKELSDGYMSKQPGFISWRQLRDGETWADAITFETREDARKVMEHEPSDLAKKFYAYINLNSCQTHLFSVERSY